MKTKQYNIGAYLAVTAGLGCAASVADAAVVFYGINSANDTNPDPSGINVGTSPYGFGALDFTLSSDTEFVRATGNNTGYYLSSGSDLSLDGNSRYGFYANSSGVLTGGATLGSSNYANISFDGDDGVFEAVAQFYLDGAGNGYLIAIATDDTGAALSISSGKAMIDAVPEPSSLALLALGSAGLLSRRQRKQAA